MSVLLYIAAMANVVSAAVNVMAFAADPASYMSAGVATANALLALILALQSMFHARES